MLKKSMATIFAILTPFFCGNTYALVVRIQYSDEVSIKHTSSGFADVALPNNDDAVFGNPASIGIISDNLVNGSISYKYQQSPGNYSYDYIFPMIVYQNRDSYFGGISVYRLAKIASISTQYYGTAPDDTLSKTLPPGERLHSEIGISYAYEFLRKKKASFALGITGTRFEQTIPETANWGKLSFGAVAKFPHGIFMGGSLKNIVSISKEPYFKMPVLLTAGGGWQYRFVANNYHIVDCNFGFQLQNMRYSNGTNNLLAATNEITILNTANILFDINNVDTYGHKIVQLGFGLHLANHVLINGYWFIPDSKFDDFKNAPSFSLSIHNFTEWKKSDLRWWKEIKE